MKKMREAAELLLILVLSVFMLLMGTSYYIVMAVSVLLIINFELAKKGHLADLGITGKKIWPAVKIQLPFTIVGVVGLLVFAFLNGYAIRDPEISYLAYWLVSIPMQEFLFRGYAQGALRGSLPATQSVVIAAALFSLIHYFANTPHTLILMGTTLLAGLAWGFAYEKERNLLGPIFSHAVLGTLLFLILPINGV